MIGDSNQSDVQIDQKTKSGHKPLSENALGFFWNKSPFIDHTELYVAMDKSIFVELRDTFTFFSDIKQV
jgi:hypothetical protein